MQKRFDKYQPERIILIGGNYKEDEWSKTQHIRDNVEKHTNSFNIIPYNPEVLKKTLEERKILKDVKKGYNIMKTNIIRFKETRDEIIHLIVSSKTPNFGSLNISVK